MAETYDFNDEFFDDEWAILGSDIDDDELEGLLPETVDMEWKDLAPETLCLYRRARDQGFNTPYKYQEHLIQQRDFSTWHEYQKHLANARKKRPENQALSALMSLYCESFDISQNDIAQRLGINNRSVSNYANGKNIPRGERLQKLFGILRTPYENIEDVVEDYPEFERCDWSRNER